MNGQHLENIKRFIKMNDNFGPGDDRATEYLRELVHYVEILEVEKAQNSAWRCCRGNQ